MEKSINFTYTKEIWNHNEININNVFSFLVATKIINAFELKTVNECRQRHDWP